ncbi:3542_t:CDS:2 [Entrophospora sp. SA101]|nr:3542_t:CDS:2 [Entrophospora sp. SA101]
MATGSDFKIKVTINPIQPPNKQTYKSVNIGQNPDAASKKSADFIQEEELIVDFTYVVKAYLSSYIMDQ